VREKKKARGHRPKESGGGKEGWGKEMAGGATLVENARGTASHRGSHLAKRKTLRRLYGVEPRAVG